MMTLLSSDVEWGLVHLGPGVSAAARPQQHLRGVHLAKLGGEVERTGAQPVGGEGSAPGHQLPDTLGVTILGGREQVPAQLHQGVVEGGVQSRMRRELTSDGLPRGSGNLDLCFKDMTI